MKTKLLLSILMIAMMAGCTSGGRVDVHDPMDVEICDSTIDISPEMIPLTRLPAMFLDTRSEASGTEVKKNTKAEIDYSNTADGYVMIRYWEKTDKAIRVIITGPSGTSYTYTLKSNGEYEVFPLSDGNGTYKFGVYENISGTQYAAVLSLTASITLTDEFAPFLHPNQYVNYSPDSKTAIKAEELTKGTDDLLDKISSVYHYVVENISYDKELAANVKSGYLPDVDAVLEKGKGICFDYAAVMSAMLRSQGIPAKLVIGYTGNIYHAWINVYSNKLGWIGNLIYFDGENWKLMDPTFASGGAKSAEIMKYIGDGMNYKAKYIY